MSFEEKNHELLKDVVELKKAKLQAAIEKEKAKTEVYKAKLDILEELKTRVE